MQTQSTGPRPLLPWHNPHAMLQGQGNAVDWSKVSAYFYQLGKFTVKLSALSAVGDTSLDVDALTYPLEVGQVIDFGEAETVVVTLSANEAIGQTELSVNALTGPVPSGAVLNFGVNEQAVLTADAAEGAISITVEALDTALESGDSAVYQGGRKQAIVDAPADAGAVAVTVEPLQFALANDAEGLADATGTGDGRRIPAGTVMSKTTAGLLIPRRDGAAGSEVQSIGFLTSDAEEGAPQDAKSGYGIVIGNTVIWENLCPDSDTAGDLPADYKTELATNTLGFVYEDWSDSRLS